MESRAPCLEKFRPGFGSAIYRAGIDVTSKHLSGILIIKAMPDSSIRLVFTSENGYIFFDLSFLAGGGFKVYSINEKMNKKAVIKTLRKDFELVLMQHLREHKTYSLKGDGLVYTAFPQTKGYYYYLTDSACNRLISMQRASSSKVVVEAMMRMDQGSIPDTIGISHKNFNFDISLKKLPN
jgi:hypothetical protein